MFEVLEDLVSRLRSTATQLECGSLRGEDAARLVELSTEGERICAAIRTMAARRVERSRVWQKAGHRTAAEWLAAETGTPVGNAIGVLESARRLEELPATRQAFVSGKVSETQAREISAAATDRRTENALLETARTQSVKTLRQECRRVRASAARDEFEAYNAIHRTRYLRTWSDPDGAVRLDARLTPDAGAEVIAALDARRARICAEARRNGRRESSQAYAADALVEIARDRNSGSRGPRAMVHVLVEHEVFVTARTRAGQRCEIPGVGPIPSATARTLAEDAILKLIVTKGSDIRAVAHAGRTIPARLRTALEVRDRACVVPGCDNEHGLEIDHYRIAFADGGPTRLDNLARLCRWHHYYQKTHLGYRLAGGPGGWIWHTPDELEGARPHPDR